MSSSVYPIDALEDASELTDLLARLVYRAGESMRPIVTTSATNSDRVFCVRAKTKTYAVYVTYFDDAQGQLRIMIYDSVEGYEDPSENEELKMITSRALTPLFSIAGAIATYVSSEAA